jgi:hypothetical protein
MTTQEIDELVASEDCAKDFCNHLTFWLEGSVRNNLLQEQDE